MIKMWGEVYQINNFQHSLNNDLSALLDWVDAKVLYFKQLYLQNGYFDLHVWYTVGKSITGFESKHIYFVRKVAISLKLARPTAIAVPRVGHCSYRTAVFFFIQPKSCYTEYNSL